MYTILLPPQGHDCNVSLFFVCPTRPSGRAKRYDRPSHMRDSRFLTPQAKLAETPVRHPTNEVRGDPGPSVAAVAASIAGSPGPPERVVCVLGWSGRLLCSGHPQAAAKGRPRGFWRLSACIERCVCAFLSRPAPQRCGATARHCYRSRWSLRSRLRLPATDACSARGISKLPRVEWTAGELHGRALRLTSRGMDR